MEWESIDDTSGVLIERLTLDFRLGFNGLPFLSKMGVEAPELNGEVELAEDGIPMRRPGFFDSGLGEGEDRKGVEAERTTGELAGASGMERGGSGRVDRTGEGERTGNGTTGILVEIVSLGVVGAASPTGVGGKSASVSVSVSVSASSVVERRDVLALCASASNEKSPK